MDFFPLKADGISEVWELTSVFCKRPIHPPPVHPSNV